MRWRRNPPAEFQPNGGLVGYGAITVTASGDALTTPNPPYIPVLSRLESDHVVLDVIEHRKQEIRLGSRRDACLRELRIEARRRSATADWSPALNSARSHAAANALRGRVRSGRPWSSPASAMRRSSRCEFPGAPVSSSIDPQIALLDFLQSEASVDVVVHSALAGDRDPDISGELARIGTDDQLSRSPFPRAAEASTIHDFAPISMSGLSTGPRAVAMPMMPRNPWRRKPIAADAIIGLAQARGRTFRLRRKAVDLFARAGPGSAPARRAADADRNLLRPPRSNGRRSRSRRRSADW